MGNKYNEQQDLAWKVAYLLLRPGVEKIFKDNLRTFDDWNEKGLIKQIKELHDRMLKKRPRLKDIKPLETEEKKQCRRFVFLAILHDKALNSPLHRKITEKCIDLSSVDIIWDGITRDWNEVSHFALIDDFINVVIDLKQRGLVD